MPHIQDLDARQRPPESFRTVFKQYSRMLIPTIETDPVIIDFARASDHPQEAFIHTKDIPRSQLQSAFHDFIGRSDDCDTLPEGTDRHSSIPVYEAVNLPGLVIVPGLFPQLVQLTLLEKLLHRDVSNPVHLTNLHPFYDLPYQHQGHITDTENSASKSFFDLPQEISLHAKDSTMHRPISVKAMMDSKLRWVTLGGQYDWTNKVYPPETPPPFPSDLAELLHSVFPEMKAQAAILNLYSPGDTLSMHRDVSEECDRPLASISIGCDAIFMVGNGDGSGILTVRVRSGDAILMTGPSRFAWHGVPKVLKGTCPRWLQSWPSTISNGESQYGSWKGWMMNKRINFNVRQITE